MQTNVDEKLTDDEAEKMIKETDVAIAHWNRSNRADPDEVIAGSTQGRIQHRMFVEEIIDVMFLQ